MSERMTARECAEVLVWWRMELRGERRSDLRSALQTSHLINHAPMRGAQAKIVVPADVMLRFKSQRVEDPVAKKLLGFAAMHGAETPEELFKEVMN